MTEINLHIRALLMAAAASPYGIAARVSDVPKMQRDFYAARKTLNLPDLSLRKSPDDVEDEVWIVRAGDSGQQDPDVQREVEAASPV